MARPRGTDTLTEEKFDAIIKDVQSGLYAGQVALRNGIHPTTLKDWVARGLQENAPEKFARFAEAYIKAEMEVEAKTLRVIRRAATPKKVKKKSTKTVERSGGTQGAPGSEEHEAEETTVREGDWRAAAFFLERRWPKRWGLHATEHAQDALNLPQLQADAETRPQDLDQLLADPPPELEDAILRQKDRILALIASSEPDAGEPQAQ